MLRLRHGRNSARGLKREDRGAVPRRSTITGAVMLSEGTGKPDSALEAGSCAPAGVDGPEIGSTARRETERGSCGQPVRWQERNSERQRREHRSPHGGVNAQGLRGRAGNRKSPLASSEVATCSLTSMGDSLATGCPERGRQGEHFGAGLVDRVGTGGGWRRSPPNAIPPLWRLPPTYPIA